MSLFIVIIIFCILNISIGLLLLGNVFNDFDNGGENVFLLQRNRNKWNKKIDKIFKFNTKDDVDDIVINEDDHKEEDEMEIFKNMVDDMEISDPNQYNKCRRLYLEYLTEEKQSYNNKNIDNSYNRFINTCSVDN